MDVSPSESPTPTTPLPEEDDFPVLGGGTVKSVPKGPVKTEGSKTRFSSCVSHSTLLSLSTKTEQGCFLSSSSVPSKRQQSPLLLRPGPPRLTHCRLRHPLRYGPTMLPLRSLPPSLGSHHGSRSDHRRSCLRCRPDRPSTPCTCRPARERSTSERSGMPTWPRRPRRGRGAMGRAQRGSRRRVRG